MVVVTMVVDEPEPRVYVRVVSEVPTGTALPPVPVPIGTDGAGVVTAPLTADPVPGAPPAGAEYPPGAAGTVGPVPAGRVPDGAVPATVVEAALYEAMAAALAAEACSTGQTVLATIMVSVTTAPADAEFLAGQSVTDKAQLRIVLVM